MSHGLPLFGPGTWLIFGIVLLPVYIMLSAWVLGDPSEKKSVLLGVGYLAGLTTLLWGGFLIVTLLIGLIFF